MSALSSCSSWLCCLPAWPEGQREHAENDQMGKEGGKYYQHCTAGNLHVVWTLQRCYVTQTALGSINTASQSSGTGKPQNRCSPSFGPHLCARSWPTPSAHGFCSCVCLQNSQRLDRGQAYTAAAPTFERERDTAMRKFVKRKQKVAARNSRFLWWSWTSWRMHSTTSVYAIY